MKVLSELKKATKAGISVWAFCYVEDTDSYFAVGGEQMKVIPANDRLHLRQLFNNFYRYGYRSELPKKQFISDPWSSELPSNMQRELELLSA
jgi:hypothetical protein